MAFSGSGNSSSFDASRVLRVPGVLVISPTSIVAPYGGTTMGRVAGGAVLTEQRFTIPLVSYDNSGAEPYDDLYSGQGEITLRVTLTEWSDDALQLAFPGLTASGASERYVQFPGTQTTGLMNGERVSVLWAPKNEADHKAIFLPSALPVLIGEEGHLTLRLLKEARFEILFKARRKVSLTDAFERGLIGKPSDLDGLTGIP